MAEAGGQETGIEEFLYEHFLSAPLAQGNAAVVFAGRGHINGAWEREGLQLAATGAGGVAELEVAAIDHEEIGFYGEYVRGKIGWGAMDDGGGAADEIEIAAEVKPGAAGGVDVPGGDVPAGMGGIFRAPIGEAAVDAIITIDDRGIVESANLATSPLAPR